MERLKVAFPILLEAIAVDDNRWCCFSFPAFLLLWLIIRFRIRYHKNQPFRIGRPGEVGDATLDVSELLRLAAGSIEQPDLWSLLLLCLVAAGGEERQVFVIRAPPGHAFAAVNRAR